MSGNRSVHVPEGDEGGVRWTDIFPRSHNRDLGYYVVGAWQGAVTAIVAAHGAGLRHAVEASMIGYGGASWRASLLDGEFVKITGVMHPEEGFSNGMWLSGRDAVRFVLYCLDVPQPRRLPGEATIPAFATLEARAQAAREASPGQWRERP